MKKRKIYTDRELDTCWIVFKKGEEAYREEIALGFSLEYNNKDELIGIEIQNFSRLKEFTPLK